MHESRIAALEDALRKLALPEVLARFSRAAVATRWAEIETELRELRGIRDRNRALDVERPSLAADDARLRERRRRIHEAIQIAPERHFTPEERAEIAAAEARLATVLAGERENVARADAAAERRRQVRENRQIARGRAAKGDA